MWKLVSWIVEMGHKFSDNSFLDQGVLIQMGYGGGIMFSYNLICKVIVDHPLRKACLGQGVEIHDLDFTIFCDNCCIHTRAYCIILWSSCSLEC
jgi:hypothetical protein